MRTHPSPYLDLNEDETQRNHEIDYRNGFWFWVESISSLNSDLHAIFIVLY